MKEIMRIVSSLFMLLCDIAILFVFITSPESIAAMLVIGFAGVSTGIFFLVSNRE